MVPVHSFDIGDVSQLIIIIPKSIRYQVIHQTSFCQQTSGMVISFSLDKWDIFYFVIGCCNVVAEIIRHVLNVHLTIYIRATYLHRTLKIIIIGTGAKHLICTDNPCHHSSLQILAVQLFRVVSKSMSIIIAIYIIHCCSEARISLFILIGIIICHLLDIQAVHF